MDHKTDTERGREALDSYLKDCEAHAIVPDVGGAWHAAFLAGAASRGKSPAHQVTVEQVEDAIGLQSTAWDTIDAKKIVDAVLRLANGQAPAPAGAFGHTIDCIGLALDLESAAKKATSQTTQRAMEAAAHGLRLLATPTPQAAQRAPAVENELWRKRLLREDIAWLEMFAPNTAVRSHIIDVLRGAMDGQAPAAPVTVEQVEDAIGLQSTAWDTIGAEKIVEAVLRLANGQAPAGAADPQLLKFYGVTKDAELIAAQARHIERLQAKLPQTPSLAPQRAREG